MRRGERDVCARVCLVIVLKQKEGNEPAAARNDVFSYESKKKKGRVHKNIRKSK